MSLWSRFNSRSSVNWKEQFNGWRRRISFILALVLILSVVGFSIGYFAGHDLKGASTWKLGFVMIISVAFGYALVQASYGFGAHFRVFYKQQYELVDVKKYIHHSPSEEDDGHNKLMGNNNNEEQQAVPTTNQDLQEEDDEEKQPSPPNKEIILTPDKTLPQYSTMQAHCIMLAVATFLFSMLYIIDRAAGWHMYVPEASPMTISIVLGGFLFGLGMQLGDACALAPCLRLEVEVYGVFIYLSSSCVAHVRCSWHSLFYRRKNKKSEIEVSGDSDEQSGLINQDYDIDTRSPLQKLMSFVSTIVFRFIYGPWDLISGSIALALLNFCFLLATQHPMGLTGPFAIIGCKILDAIAPSLDVPKWSAWKDIDLRKANMLFNSNFILDFGIVYGAVIVALLRGKFPSFLEGFSLKNFSLTGHKQQASIWSTLRRILNNIGHWIKNNIGLAIAKIIGGICMGIGAKFGYGCNIGAYFSGVSCMSIHGYSWIIMALLGGYIGAVVRPLFGYKKRKVACGTVCNTASIY
ncbi:hypothetical protein C9374_004367 [Naegleria lovaniensis]|uniref:Uncharacterized protein n=1 Tax=Naegleria lovaniensis TaxID=51637 RepID=A0AA88GQX3_NAELO|nr:uncharacterized protein C9374_004367 [Naegleria lovaniensis]KAG2383696.1 hypothetical protein C9374_004367 [Naegleria lovaniensis]